MLLLNYLISFIMRNIIFRKIIIYFSFYCGMFGIDDIKFYSSFKSYFFIFSILSQLIFLFLNES
jgi:hypothetical protein